MNLEKASASHRLGSSFFILVRIHPLIVDICEDVKIPLFLPLNMYCFRLCFICYVLGGILGYVLGYVLCYVVRLWFVENTVNLPHACHQTIHITDLQSFDFVYDRAVGFAEAHADTDLPTNKKRHRREP